MIGTLIPSRPSASRASRLGLRLVAGALCAAFAGILLRTGAGPVLFAGVIRAGGSYSLGYALFALLPAAAGVAMLRAHRRRQGARSGG